MKDSVFTPGPWEVQYEFNVMGGGHVVASCGGYSSNVNPEAIHQENVANARLIAAAPELLDALRILTRPEKQLELTPMGYAIFRLDAADLKQISEAISKAEGRA